MSAVRTGAQRLCADPTLAGPGRLGLITNFTGVLPDLTSTVDGARAAGVELAALFSPEHGIRGTVQAGYSEAEAVDPASGLPVFDTYLKSGAALDELLVDSTVDTLLYDLQDIGTRFYTYIWTMFDVMVSAARTGKRFVVLDRPNPVGGAVCEGPGLSAEFASFVGRVSVPVRHGLTVGELARHLNASAVPAAAGRPVDLDVIALDGWRRDMTAADTGQPWVMPSPNVPTADSALVYPGTGLFEGTNLSEGRGTTRPFELIGAPYLDARFVPALRALELPGAAFREVWFTPTFHKYAGQALRGVQVHVTDAREFEPVRTAVTMLATLRDLYPDGFGWRTNGSGVEQTAHRHFVDLLWGSDDLRRTLDAGGDPRALVPPRSAPVGDHLLYP
ncbi:exo-beta-N-acetylmuramidase NamZ family protein [Actinocatenispora rupis]|uniref:DUF1343 domain-containing protein n=1 Tax=Actinocatenispora rupis TaxID=519421 RepID=A0A8J3NE70_9ACTN|nr:DUF1343 domain-containing protein [Actinocatenispora rupis]GID13747.1 hypothetical protein Aru02nite_46360 [Actinocatenispora rupis]